MIGRLLLSVLVAALAVACGPDEDNNENSRNIITDPSNTTNNSNNGGTNNTTGMTNNMTEPSCDDLECPSDRRCVRGVCVPADSSVACETPEAIGSLATGMVYAGTGDNTGYVDAVSTVCAQEVSDLYSGAEFGYSFTVPDPGSVRFEIVGTDSTFEWVAEVRQDCLDAGFNPAENNTPPDNMEPPTAKCASGPVLGFSVEPDTEYFILVEPNNSIDFGSFDWELTYEADACARGRTCQGDDILYCDGETEEVWGCGTGCAEDACVGDSCDTAIEVTAAMSFSGDIAAFTDTLNFAGTNDCNEDPMETGGTDSPGEELIFSLPGLTAGQMVVVDTSMDNNANDVFVLDSCSTNATCLAVSGSDLLEWTVEADGDYFVVIDKGRSGQEEPFNVAIDIQ